MTLSPANNRRKSEGTMIPSKIQYEATFSPHGTSTTEMIYQKDDSICILSRSNSYQRTIAWSHGPVQDVCYSKTLEKFILMTSTKCFILDTKDADMMIVEQVPHVSPMDENCHFQSCACYKSMIFLTYSEENYPVEQREINSDGDGIWKVIKHWQTMLKPNDICKCVRFIKPDEIGLIINNPTKKTASMNMLSLRSGQLSKNHDLNMKKKYHRFFCLAPDEFIFIPENHTHLFLVAHEDMMYREFPWPLPPFQGGIQISFSGWWPYCIPE